MKRPNGHSAVSVAWLMDEQAFTQGESGKRIAGTQGIGKRKGGFYEKNKAKTGDRVIGSCENNSRENSGSESGSQENETAGEVVTIKYLRPGTEVEHNDELVQAINEKLAADGTGLQLEIVYVPSDVFSDKVNMMLQGGDEFDLLAVMEDQKSFTTYIGSEGIIPITQYVKDSEVLNRVIPQYMWESATVGGEIYTIPANWTENADQACCITIRREKLEEYELEDPKTMEDLLNMCEVFTENWDGPSAPVIIPMYKEPFTWLFRTLDTYPCRRT